ncbi:hypothetical protein RRG08_037051 [Elysia crispata]|uniref:Uncharacterized protein n=1 Tax=Elysia crispata TaxID=231223 RepID=A0AAE1CVQ5_9GAST|nr:hypothetical protein RRG08_037051 [Elysia crispata]
MVSIHPGWFLICRAVHSVCCFTFFVCFAHWFCLGTRRQETRLVRWRLAAPICGCSKASIAIKLIFEADLELGTTRENLGICLNRR